MKKTVLIIVALTIIQLGYSQQLEVVKIKKDKIRLAPGILKQDSAMATWPLIASVVETSKSESPDLQEITDKCNINFYTDTEDGIVYIEFENLSKEIKPDLYLSNTKGDVIYKTRAKTRLNVINLRKIPSGKYLVTADVNEEISTWEVVKE